MKLSIKRFVGTLVKDIVNKMMWSNEAVQATSLPPLSINTAGPPTPVSVVTSDSPTMAYDSRGQGALVCIPNNLMPSVPEDFRKRHKMAGGRR
jgi:hypothetical protein